MKNTQLVPFALAAALTAAAQPAAAADNPFSTQALKGGYQVAQADKKADGKCGEAKCGAQTKAAEKKKEGKCGEAKCGNDKKPAGACGAGKKAEGQCGNKK